MARRLYVGGLSTEIGNAELKTFFEQAGTVESATVVTDRDSGRSKGFAFVEMATGAETQRAISELNGKTLGDRPITVEEARPQGHGGGRSNFGARRGRGGRW